MVEILQIEPGQTGKQESRLKCPSRVGVVYAEWRREFVLIFKLIFTMRFQGLDEKVPCGQQGGRSTSSRKLEIHKKQAAAAQKG